jgi:hypothetical protein
MHANSPSNIVGRSQGWPFTYRQLVLGLVTIVATLGNFRSAPAATAFSTDGEATVYVAGAFNRPFRVSYGANLSPQPRNRSWSTLSIALLGGPPPSDSISVGIYPSQSEIVVFTFVTRGRISAFRRQRISCSRGCRLALVGDRWSIEAVVDGHIVSRWPRFEFRLPRPSLQLNAEVDAPGDRLNGRLLPIELEANGKVLRGPSCSFTTRGIVALESSGSLNFSGEYDPKAGSFYRSIDGQRTAESCDQL